MDAGTRHVVLGRKVPFAALGLRGESGMCGELDWQDF